MSIAACKHCGEDIVFLWDPTRGKWRPGDVESLTGDETRHEGGVVLERWHRSHRCPSKFKREGMRQPAPAPAGSPHAVLHLLSSAPPEVIKAAYRALSILNHPDRGGSHIKMVEINAAYEALAGER